MSGIAFSMTANSPSAFFLSASLHALVVALLLLFSFAAGRMDKEEPKIFELVAGEGDNYGANVAPALGTEGGLKITVPQPPAPEPRRVEPAKPEPMPITPAPQPAPPKPKQEVKPAPKEEPVPNFAKQVVRARQKAESKGKREAAKQRAVEEKRAAEERKRMTMEEFRRQHKIASAAPAKSGRPNVRKIDAEGIKKGVLGGSSQNKLSGAGGKALTATEGSLAERYMEMLKQRLLEEVEARSASLPDGLRADAEFHIMSDGRLMRARIVKSSKNEAFDAAVLEAIAAIRMPARPKGVEELYQVPFVTTPKDRR